MKFEELTDFSGAEENNDFLPFLNLWRPYAQHESWRIVSDKTNRYLRNMSAAGVGLRPGVVLYKIIAGLEAGTVLQFSMRVRSYGVTSLPKLSVYYGVAQIVKETQLEKDKWQEIVSAPFAVDARPTIIGIENSVFNTPGNDYDFDWLKIESFEYRK